MPVGLFKSLILMNSMAMARELLDVAYLGYLGREEKQMKRKTSILAGVFAAATMAAAPPASALLITGTANFSPVNFSFLGLPGNVSLTGNYDIDVTAFSSTSVTLLVTLTNTTSTSNVRLVSWGFGTDPNITGAAFSDPQGSDGGMIGAAMGTGPNTIPNTGNAIEACAFGGNNCAGGANGGIQSLGGSDQFQLVLSGNWGQSLTLDPFGYKFQGANSYECLSTRDTSTCSGSPPPPPPGRLLPEPGSLALVGLGALGLGAIRRRRKLFDPNLGDK